MRKIWLLEEINYLRDNFKLSTCNEIARYLGRSTKSVQHKYNQLKLSRLPKIGDIYTYLEILEIFQSNKTTARCKCKCGNIIEVRLTSLVQHHTKSCGCYKVEVQRRLAIKRNYKHGVNKTTRLYRIWSQMRCRCNNSHVKGYKYYGARGIKVSPIWDNYSNFEKWALENNYQDNLSLDRINVNGNYEPSNCRWSDIKTQCRNKRNNRMDTVMLTVFGETKSIYEWTLDDRCKLKETRAICYRIGAGWLPEDIISKPSCRSI